MALIRLFQGLSEIEQIEFQVLKPDGFGDVILAGVVDRERVLAPERQLSLRMRLLNLGVTYQMADIRLMLPPANSSLPGFEQGKYNSSSRHPRPALREDDKRSLKAT